MSKSTWQHDEIFPLVAKVILMKHNPRNPRYIEAGEITEELMKQPRILKLVIDSGLPVRFAVGNMVAWFSQSITVRRNPYAPQFSRVKVRGLWAYQPKQGR